MWSHPEDAQSRADLNYLWDRYESYRMQDRLPSGDGDGGGYSPTAYASAARTQALLPGELELQRADITHTQALAREVVERLGGQRYEDERNRILDKIDQENWTKQQALDEFHAWMEGALEAGKRAEKVYDEEMKRKAWTTPGEYYPGMEPGGEHEQWTEKHGVPYTARPGIAVETLPSLEQMYGQWHENMGISQQAPPTQGGWSGQGAQGGGAPMGGQGKGYDAAMAFLDQLRQRYAGKFGAARA